MIGVHLLFWGLVSSLAAAELPQPRNPVQIDPLTMLAEYLRHAGSGDRQLFADIALVELIQGYGEELAPGRGKVGDEKQRWFAATRTYVERLKKFHQHLTATREVTILIDPGPSLRLLVGTQSVIVDEPRIHYGRHIHRRIVERFCDYSDCPDFATLAATRVPWRQRQRWASWSFGGGQPPMIETSAGLGFRFRDQQRLRWRQQAALDFITRLENLVFELRWYHARGLPVDWDSFHLTRHEPIGGCALVVNRAGDYLPLDIPVCDLPAAAVSRWFNARLTRARFNYIFEHAEAVLGTGPTEPHSSPEPARTRH